MTKPLILPPIGRKRGNPNWGKPIPPVPAGATEFEKQVQKLGLRKETCVASTELRKWCERNRTSAIYLNGCLTRGELRWTSATERRRSLRRASSSGSLVNQLLSPASCLIWGWPDASVHSSSEPIRARGGSHPISRATMILDSKEKCSLS